MSLHLEIICVSRLTHKDAVISVHPFVLNSFLCQLPSAGDAHVLWNTGALPKNFFLYACLSTKLQVIIYGFLGKTTMTVQFLFFCLSGSGVLCRMEPLSTKCCIPTSPDICVWPFVDRGQAKMVRKPVTANRVPCVWWQLLPGSGIELRVWRCQWW